MKPKVFVFLILAFAISAALAAPDSLVCRMVDWMDAPGETFYDDGNDCWPPDYSYSGTKNWDLAMGDSFMVWITGGLDLLIVNPYEGGSIDTIYKRTSYSNPWRAAVIIDSIVYVVTPEYVHTFYFEDSLRYSSSMLSPLSSYHFAALEDSFLYTVGGPGGALTCINVADPESIFIYRTVEGGGSKRGIEVIDGYVYNAWSWLTEDEFSGESSFSFHTSRADMLNSPTPWVDNYYGPSFTDKFFGSTANDGEFVYYVNTEIGSWPDWTIGESDLYVLDTDTSYNFDDKWDGQPAIGIDIVNEHLAAIGFKHGFSILDIDDLSDIHEVAYYMDPDSQFYCTHFAMKDTVLYAVAHPAAGGCRLYMFHLADSVVSSISDPAPQTALPAAFAISAYPNPFNSAVTIAIDIPVGDGSPVPISVEIYDVNGRRVETVTEPVEVPVGYVIPDPDRESRGATKNLDSRFHGNDRTVIWRPHESLPSGVYLVRASVSGETITKRVVYLK